VKQNQVIGKYLRATRDRFFRGGEMLRWALAFFIFALVAAILGFAGIAAAAAGIVKILSLFLCFYFLRRARPFVAPHVSFFRRSDSMGQNSQDFK